MNREIKFRGKRKDYGEWVYGYFQELGDETRIITIQPSNVPIEVIPETVGQFTGLKDKHGKDIYEGDVVRERYGNDYTPIFRNGIYMAFNVEDLHLLNQEPSTQFNVIWRDSCEVIGNIYDNPEMLEV